MRNPKRMDLFLLLRPLTAFVTRPTAVSAGVQGRGLNSCFRLRSAEKNGLGRLQRRHFSPLSIDAAANTMVKTRRFITVKRFEGEPKPSDLKLVEEELPPLKDGEFLCKAVWMSVDPYMRAYAPRVPLGMTMMGSQVAEIIESKNPKFKVGQNIVGYFGWQTYSISDGSESAKNGLEKPFIIPDFKGLPLSLALGVLGMPGNTAYFGFLELCQPKSGETVVVTGAAGAVGSIVGQIAKIKGCKVIGFAGTDEKCKWLTEDLKFDAAFNYKKTTVAEALKKAAPNGVDCYFDNVGGETSSEIIRHMNDYGRISVCGSISTYNATDIPKATVVQMPMISKQLKMEGFLVHRWSHRWEEGILQILQWIKEGKIKYNETVTEGFEKMPTAFINMLRGENVGKAVVKV
ncbi:prostaglandin reductase 1-like [Ischnura elegans]|uniref:prostaglandin reductase 1-like n=1 Tax=Ischnura elegans TaxID=197161 RepID=UPI001ED86D4F|nr:prostaglandin reductase 1-like [Ischnura elegans]